MKRRVRHHVNPFALRYVVPRTEPIPLPAGPVEVELGCAEGNFLFERARVVPEALQIGLEIREEMVAEVNERAAVEGAPVVAVFTNINVDLEHRLPPDRVRRMFLNFPDPCFKERQRKRRVVERGMLAGCHRALEPGGELLFQSDVFDLALDAMATIEDYPDWFENVEGPWSFLKTDNPFGARTRRERYNMAAGVRIWRILYRKVGARVLDTKGR